MAKKDISDVFAQFQNLKLEQVGSWPLAPRMAVWGGVMVVCMVAGWFVVWSGQFEQLDQLRSEEVTLREQYRGKLQQAITLDELKRQREQVSQYVLRLERQLPSKAEMEALLSDINQAGVGRGLDFELFRPGQTETKQYYSELPISIKVTGKYHDLGSFAADIAQLPRIVTLNNLNIQSGKGGSLLMDATAKTFRYLDQDEIAEQRKAQQNKGRK